jgi:putative spermidine/putrescine transport system permease protein
MLFFIPLYSALDLIFTKPIYSEPGQAIYTNGTYDYHYKSKINRYVEMDSEKPTGKQLKPYEMKSNPEEYKKKKKIGIENLKIFFTTRKYYIAIFNTLKLVLSAAAVQFILAFSMAYFMRRKIKGKFMYTSLVIFPLTLGSLIIAGGMTNFFSTGGWFNMLFMKLGIIDKPVEIIYTYWGTFISVVIGTTPFLFSGFLPICEGIDENLEIAARTLGANEFMMFIKVFLPLAMPSLLSILSLSMVLNMATYPSAVLVGDPAGSTRVMAVVAFEEFRVNMDYNMAATTSLVLVILQIMIIGIISAVRKRLYIGYGGSFK